MSARARLAVGLALLVASAYALTGPGRLDTIDAAYRFEGATHLVEHGDPVLTSPWLVHGQTFYLADGRRYATYGLARLVEGVPLSTLGRWVSGGDPSASRFAFSLTSAFVGGAVPALLFWTWTALGVSRRRALAWALVAAFGTLLWPMSATTFDVVQHGAFALAALALGAAAARRDSAAWAALGGLAGGVLVNYHGSYRVFLPVLALSTLGPLGDPHARRRNLVRYAAFLAGALPGVAAWSAWDAFRQAGAVFAGAAEDGADKSGGGDLLAGLAGLLASPGRSAFLFSPPLVLALVGLPALVRRSAGLGLAAVGFAAGNLLSIATLAYWAGDWCWGPRYLVPGMPAALLGLAFFPAGRRSWRRAAGALVGAGFVVQVLGVSLDHSRYYLERRAAFAYIWHEQPDFHWSGSALSSRPGEIATTWRDGVPEEAVAFAPSPSGDPTDASLLNPGRPREASPAWSRRFRVFHLPKPWPLWMAALPRGERPFPPWIPAVLLALAAAAGLGIVRRGWTRDDEDPAPDGAPPASPCA